MLIEGAGRRGLVSGLRLLRRDSLLQRLPSVAFGAVGVSQNFLYPSQKPPTDDKHHLQAGTRHLSGLQTTFDTIHFNFVTYTSRGFFKVVSDGLCASNPLGTSHCE